ncbi:MAG: aminopeptidase [Spirochaetales bacterium]|nr:aminopeptidase [Candidatus Physcosoma equi]
MDLFYEKYEEAILFYALKIKSSEVLSINTEEEDYAFARLLATKAKAVTGNGSYIQLLRNGRIAEEFDILSDSPLSKSPTAFIYIPLYKKMDGIELGRVYEAPELQRFKLLSDPLGNPAPSLPFLTCPLPCTTWDYMIDEEDGNNSSSTLLFNILGMENDDYLSRLDMRSDNLAYQKRKLNRMQLSKGRIVNDEGTDLEFSFLEGSEFTTTYAETQSGRVFNPFVYSSDIFRLLDPTSLNGWLNLTKPMMVFGKRISSFSIRFENGRVVEYKGNNFSEAVFKLYLEQDPNAGVASMLTLSEISNLLEEEDLTGYPEFDRMRTVSITIGGPKGEAVTENTETRTIDSMVTLPLSCGSESTVINVLDKDGEEWTIYSGGYLIEEEEDD